MSRKPPTAEQRAKRAEAERARRARRKAQPPTDEYGFPASYADAEGENRPDPTAAIAGSDTGSVPGASPVAESAAQPPAVREPVAPTSAGNTFPIVCLSYDIPSNSKISNPSGDLRRLGFRFQLSAWVVPEASIPHNLIHTMRAEGFANVRVLKFDASETPTLLALAVEKMRESVEDQLKRARKQIADAADRHLALDPEEINNPEAREAALTRYGLRAAANLEYLERILADVTEAAAGFGLDPATLSLAHYHTALDALQQGANSRATAYATATQALKAVGTLDATALASAAAADRVPVAVLAGALEDAGAEPAAAELVAAFAAPGSDEYRLTDAE